MIITRRKLIDARQTGKLMHKMIEKYHMDMAPYASLSYLEIFDLVKSLPFRPDPKGVELLKRPYYTIKRIGAGGDCDDKTIVVCSWAEIVGIPWRIMGVGNRTDPSIFSKIKLSHVRPELYIGGRWISFDCTYEFNILEKNPIDKYDRMEIL